MWNRELLRRIDAHLARGNHLMAENTEVIAECKGVIADNARAFDDLRDFLAEQTQALRGLTREIKEFGAEMAAQRRALFRILDKLD